MIRNVLLAALGIAATGGSVQAADLAPPMASTWTGPYLGVHLGYDLAALETDDLFAADVDPEGFLGGFQLGYNLQFSNGVVLGAEADISFADLTDDRETVVDTGPPGDIVTRSDSEISALGTVRGRLGYSFGPVLPYISGGLAWARHSFDYEQDYPFGFTTRLDESETHIGWTVGAGVEVRATDELSLRIDYAYADFGDEEYSGTSLGIPFEAEADLNAHIVKLGLNYHF